MPEPQFSSPFGVLYGELVRAALAHPWCPKLVNARNLIRFDTPASTDIKERVNDGDLPELVLAASGGTHKIGQDSSHVVLQRKYVWLVSTGEVNLQAKLYPVEWMLVEAMEAVGATIGGLEWKGNRFVERFDLADVAEGLTDPARNREIRGWSASLGIEVQMRLLRQAMVERATAATGG